MAVRLTDEQQRIVQHNHGPALVFAVAGAGKTTTMVHRIERLVREGVFDPQWMLASSFSRATVADLKKALAQFPHAATVNVKTLHGLAYSMLTRAMTLGLTPEKKLPTDMDYLQQAILNKALTAARARGEAYARELDSLDREDFLAYVGSCKANLSFPDLKSQRLPKKTVATQARAPQHLSWYLDLFQLYELEREQMAVLTYDDLIPQAWQLLITNDQLRQEYQQSFDAVMVDEFQDVNLSQVELLDVLVQEHKNYFVVGDDDQGIFSWRGASNEFILNFSKRYGATRYVISDNFRCFAEHTFLANHVIMRNSRRAPKQLSNTRGFGGSTLISAHDSTELMGLAIAKNIKAALKSGSKASDIAILIRHYAETGFIEYGLIEQNIPYTIIGNVPFYDRPENKLLLKYLRVAQIEQRMQSGEKLSPELKRELGEIWWDVLRTPKRYLRRDNSDTILREVLVKNTPPSDALLLAGSSSHPSISDKLLELGSTIAWLSQQVTSTRDAYLLLLELEQRLAYKQHLLDNSGFAETGQGKAQNVQAFIEYAKGKGSPLDFLIHLERISFGAAGRERKDRTPRVLISTVFRAKGLEWPHVILPAVNYGHYPAAGNTVDLSEERRLFYVALTRTQHQLELHVVKDRPPSMFMEGLTDLGKQAGSAARAFRKPVVDWDERDALAVVPLYHYLARFIEVWSDLEEPEQRLLGQWLAAANQALAMKKRAVLSAELVKKLLHGESVDEAKVALCAARLGGRQAGVVPTSRVAPSAQPYDAQRDGVLKRGTRVRHKMHGDGRIVQFGSESSFEFVEISFDKGRTVRLSLKLASFEILS